MELGSATGGGNVSGVHRRQSRQAPSRVWAMEACNAGMLQWNHLRCTGCIHSMQCIPVSKPIHPAAVARHFTRHHCYARAFLFHSQTATDIPSVVNGRWAANSLALIHVQAQTTPIESDSRWQVCFDWTTSLISCARLSCFCRVVYFFILKFSLVTSREFSIMSLASGGFAPRPSPGLRPWTLLGEFRPPDPLFRIPFMKILDPPLLPVIVISSAITLSGKNLITMQFYWCL